MTILLFDADVTIYKAAFSNEVATETSDGYWTWHCDINKVKQSIDSWLAEMMDTLNGDSYKLCLSDDKSNFRKSLSPAYKEKRTKVKRPLVLKPIREWLISERKAIVKPSLEGDDILGILATSSVDDTVIVSTDKDMKTIPGRFYRNDVDGIVNISKEEADYHHLYQTLTGDITDGYTGLPGVGPKKAEEILSDPTWKSVVKAYKTKGYTEEYALLQARLAKILRHEDYNFTTNEPILWTPS